MINIKRELSTQKRIASVIGKSDAYYVIILRVLKVVVKQIFCCHLYRGLKCIKCGKQIPLQEFYLKQ